MKCHGVYVCVNVVAAAVAVVGAIAFVAAIAAILEAVAIAGRLRPLAANSVLVQSNSADSAA